MSGLEGYQLCSICGDAQILGLHICRMEQSLLGGHEEKTGSAHAGFSLSERVLVLLSRVRR